MYGTDKSPLLKWQKPIPDDKEASRILFGEESPFLESLEQLREKSLQNDAITSHLWRDGALKLLKSEQRSTCRTTLLTERGCLAIFYPLWCYRDGPKICALYGSRSLFILFPMGALLRSLFIASYVVIVS